MFTKVVEMAASLNFDFNACPTGGSLDEKKREGEQEGNLLEKDMETWKAEQPLHILP